MPPKETPPPPKKKPLANPSNPKPPNRNAQQTQQHSPSGQVSAKPNAWHSRTLNISGSSSSSTPSATPEPPPAKPKNPWESSSPLASKLGSAKVAKSDSDEASKQQKPVKQGDQSQQQAPPAHVHQQQQQQQPQDDSKQGALLKLQDARDHQHRTRADYDEAYEQLTELSARENLPEDIAHEIEALRQTIGEMEQKVSRLDEISADEIDEIGTQQETLTQAIRDLLMRSAQSTPSKKSTNPPASKPKPKGDDESKQPKAKKGGDDEKAGPKKGIRRLSQEEYEGLWEILQEYGNDPEDPARDAALLKVLHKHAQRNLALPTQEELSKLLDSSALKGIISIDQSNRFVLAAKKKIDEIAGALSADGDYQYHSVLQNQLSESDKNKNAYSLTYKALACLEPPDSALMRRLMADPSQLATLGPEQAVQAVWFLAGGWAEAARHPTWRGMFNMLLDIHDSGLFSRDGSATDSAFLMIELFPPRTKQAVLAMNYFNALQAGKDPSRINVDEHNYDLYLHRSSYLIRTWTMVTLLQSGQKTSDELASVDWETDGPALFEAALKTGLKGDPTFLGTPK